MSCPDDFEFLLGVPTPAEMWRQFRSVHVRAYRRFRFGQWEDVCAHWRSHPGQLTLF